MGNKEFQLSDLKAELDNRGLLVSPSTIYNLLKFFQIQPSAIYKLPNQKLRYCYDRRALVKLAWELRKRFQKKRMIKEGLHRCYVCGNYYPILISGLCHRDHALKFVKNYVNDGEFGEYIYNEEKARCLFDAICSILKT